MSEINYEYKAEGVNVLSRDAFSTAPNNNKIEKDQEMNRANEMSATSRMIKNKHNSRSIIFNYSPKIYVDDGSRGTNLINTYSYKNYCEVGEKPSRENNYHNNYRNLLTTNAVYDGIDGLRLHPTAESGGYSNFTIPQFIKR